MPNERQQRAARAEQMRKEREKADRKQRNLISLAIVVVVIALIAVGGYAIKKTSDANQEATKVVTPKNTGKDSSVIYSTEAATGTAAKNPVTVVAYEDLQCPACRAFEAETGAFLTQAVQNGDISLEYRLISFLDKSSSTNYSSRAGSAALCVADQGGIKAFKKMHDLLYANQPAEGTAGLDDKTLISYAKQAGVDSPDSCIKTKRFGPWLFQATDASRSAGVDATPTVLVDGKKLDAPSLANLQKAIAAAKQ